MLKEKLHKVIKVGLLLTVFLSVCAFAARAGRKDQSVWDGVYTDDQAARGKTAFEANCSSCHMLTSDFAGDTFMTRWKSHSAFDVFDVMSTSMPMDRPGELKKPMYADILAYFFQTNTFPSGATELAPDPDALKQIRIEPKPLRAR